MAPPCPPGACRRGVQSTLTTTLLTRICGRAYTQDPATVYQREGWVGYPDWLGYAETAPPPEQVGKQLEDEAEAWTALSCHLCARILEAVCARSKHGQ